MNNPKEKELLKSFENGEWESIKPSKKTLKRYRDAARATLAKDKRVNIRIASRDLDEIQAKAIEEGIPSQTLMASVLHKYVTGKLTEKRND